MTLEEYKNRIMEIRILVNKLSDDIGVTWETCPAVLEKILNDAMNADTTRAGYISTKKIINVVDFRSDHSGKWITRKTI